jgi:hypothetical protein
VSPAAKPIVVPPESPPPTDNDPKSDPRSEPKGRRRSTNRSPAPVESVAAPPPPPQPAINPHRIALQKLRGAADSSRGMVELGEQLESEAKQALAREQAATISACVGQSRLTATPAQGLDKLGQCIDKLETLKAR